MREEPKFDIHWHSEAPSLDYHFCREWDGDTGCYGTNPDHGYTFDEAKEEIAKWHSAQAVHWRQQTLKSWGHMTPEEIEAAQDAERPAFGQLAERKD